MSTNEWPEFKAYGKTARLGSKVQITEKIDGTNAHILVVTDDSCITDTPSVPKYTVYPASRNRWLPEDEQDNYGFGAWVRANAASLAVILGPGRHYGEWWGEGIARGYGVTGKRFSLFDTRRYAHLLDVAPWDIGGAVVGVVPIIAEGLFSDQLLNDAREELEHTGSKAAPGFMRPEGLIIRWADNGHVMKVVWDKGEKLGRHSTPKQPPTKPKWTPEQIEEAREAARLRAAAADLRRLPGFGDA
jgi:hypothetical protein